jgi:hypothetical protein
LGGTVQTVETPRTPHDVDRRTQLLGVKLRALVAEQLGTAVEAEPVPFPLGAALRLDQVAWVLLDQHPDHRLGAAMAWALRAGATELHIVADSGGGLLARRAAEFVLPITIWRSQGRDLVRVSPEPHLDPGSAPAAHLELQELIAAGGASPVVEHGVVFGEVRGLEVCRVVEVEGDARLEIGVGVHDREAFAMLHANAAPVDSLARVVAAVAAQRRLEADRHPFNRLARERLLRWCLEQEPARVGAVSLAPAQPPVPRQAVGDTVPCVAQGRSSDGRGVTVVCSSGVDLELVPYAADARAMAGAGEPRRLVLAIPSRDRLPLVDQMVALLGQSSGWDSAELVSID